MPETCVSCGLPFVMVHELDGHAIAIDPEPVDGGELALRGDPLNIPEGEFVAAFHNVGPAGDPFFAIPAGAPRWRRHECARRCGAEQEIDMYPKEIDVCAQVLSEKNGGRRVVLYVDPTMQYGENYLPTLNVEGDTGFYRFPDMARPIVARFFGADYRAAKDLVDQVNEARGIDRGTALDIVVKIIVHDKVGPAR